VLKADDPASALSVLRSGVHCDLLFTDVVMPGQLKSPELARQATALLPNLRVLYTSGYTQNAIIHGGRLDPGVELISKPYTRDELARKVRQLLERTAAASPAEPPRKRVGKRILLVEDEPDALEMTVEILRMMGHQVNAVASAEAALPLLDTESFDLLLSDINLPGMSGIQLARRLHEVQPGVALVFISGAGDIDEQAAKVGARFLLKPFALGDLRAVLG